MISSRTRSFLLHLRLRSRACRKSLEGWLVLGVFGATATVLWPTAIRTGPVQGTSAGPLSLVVYFLWLWLMPAVLMVVVRGRATRGQGDAPLGTCPAPALPLSPRTRALAEAVFAVTMIALLRWALIAIFNHSLSPAAGLESLSGALDLLPMAVIWALPVENPPTFMIRPIAIAMLSTFVLTAGGFFDTWPGVVLGCVFLTVLALFAAAVEVPEFRPGGDSHPVELTFRDGLEPERRLARDAWLPPLKTWGPWLLLSIVFYGICLYLDIHGRSVEWILFVGFEAHLIICLQPAFRPLNLNMLKESMVGNRSVGWGAFIRAWSVLPVDPVAVLRKVWFHGIICGLLLWSVPVVILVLRHGFISGVWSFSAGIGEFMPFVVVGALFVPILAATLVSVAVGRRLESILSGLCLVFGAQLLLLLKVIIVETLGRESLANHLVPILVSAAVVAVGALPPLRFLFRKPELA